MPRPLTALLAASGLLALAGVLARRRGNTAQSPAEIPNPRAMELRRKLAESRAVVDEREEFEQAETPIDEAEAVDDKRRRVHERGRAAADEMRGPERA